MKPLRTYRLKEEAKRMRWWTERDGTGHVYLCFTTYVVAGALFGPQQVVRRTLIGRPSR